MSTALSEEQLVVACQADKPEAWTEVYRRYGRLIRRALACRGWGFADEDTEDLVQEVLVRLHSALPEFDGRCSLKTFVVSVTSHVAADELRRRTALKRGGPDAGGVGLAEAAHLDNPARSHAPPADEIVIRHEAVALARRALAQADGRCRRVLTMFYFEGMKQREIAEAHGVALGTAAAWLYRCLARLQTAVFSLYGEDEGASDPDGTPADQ